MIEAPSRNPFVNQVFVVMYEAVDTIGVPHPCRNPFVNQVFVVRMRIYYWRQPMVVAIPS